MKNVKKAGILAGAVAGGIIGGTVSIIGKLTHKKIIDNVGESVVDSLIYAGSIAGNLVSGAADVVVGNIQDDKEQVEEGLDDLKGGGKMLVGNWIHNAKLVVGESGDIIKGVRAGDTEKIKEGVKTIGQIAVVGAMTVGAIRLKKDEKEKSENEAENGAET